MCRRMGRFTVIGRRLGLSCAVAVFACLALASSAFADRVAVVEVEGARAKAVQRTLVGQLRKDGHKVTVVSDESEATDVSAIITAEIKKRGKRWQVRIVVKNAADGDVLGKTTLRARKAKRLPGLVRKLFRKRLGRAVRRGEMPSVEPEPEPEPEIADEPEVADEPEPEPEPVDQEPEPADEPARSSGSLGVSRSVTRGNDGIALSVSMSGRVFSRTFAYNDDLFDALSEYEANVTPAVVVSADAYWKKFGAAASMAYTRPFDSRTEDEVAFPTDTVGYTFGGRYRLLTGDLGATVGVDYGARDFNVDDAPSRAKPEIPDVAYRFIRAGLATQMRLGKKMSVGADAGYRYVLSAGEIETEAYFPRLSVGGVDATAWFGYDLASAWQVQLGANVERYFYSMNPEPGDARVAGGATDQFVGVQLGLAYRH